VLSHFLWCAGNPLQRNVKGTLCALLYQLLLEDEGLSTSILEKIPVIRTPSAVTDWSEQDLEKFLQQALTNTASGTCIFIDGLDEIDASDGPPKILCFVRRLQETHRTKVCVSSRPEMAFQKGLNHAPSLRLQNLTKYDIHHLVAATLGPYFPSAPQTECPDFETLVSEICSRAQGVFLWVRLVLKSLQRGLENGDSLEEIRRRVGAFPRGLHELFKEMWTRLGEDQQFYQVEASRYFNLALDSVKHNFEALPFMGHLNILLMAIALDDWLKASRMGLEIRLDCEEIRRKCERTKNHVTTRCAGFLECHSETKRRITVSRSEYSSLIPLFRTKVRFIHRSAFDFLLSTTEGKEILSLDQSTFANRWHSRLRANLTLAHFWTPFLRGNRCSRLSTCGSASEWLRSLSIFTYELTTVPVKVQDHKTLIWQCFHTYHTGRFPYFRTRAHIPSLEPGFICALALAGSPGLVKSMEKMVNHAYQEYIAHCLISMGMSMWNMRISVPVETLKLIEFAAIIQSIRVLDKRVLTPLDIVFWDDDTRSTHSMILGFPRSLVQRLTSLLICGFDYPKTHNLHFVYILTMLNEVVKQGTSMTQQVIFSHTRGIDVMIKPLYCSKPMDYSGTLNS